MLQYLEPCLAFSSTLIHSFNQTRKHLLDTGLYAGHQGRTQWWRRYRPQLRGVYQSLVMERDKSPGDFQYGLSFTINRWLWQGGPHLSGIVSICMINYITFPIVRHRVSTQCEEHLMQYLEWVIEGFKEEMHLSWYLQTDSGKGFAGRIGERQWSWSWKGGHSKQCFQVEWTD